MHRLARSALAIVALVVVGGPVSATAASATAAADQGAESTVLPFSQRLRRCDFSTFQYVGGSGYGRPTGQLRIEGGELVADIQFATGVPNTRYEVKLIQVPRSSALTCNAGDPGVAVAPLTTDAGGAGTTTVRGPIQPGATGAWLSVTRPSAFSQVPEEFYSTDLIVDV